MSKVYDVDPKLIQRTQQWLAAQQQADGSWKPDTNFINEGATNRYNTDVLRITAYIAWALENTGYQGPAVEKARQFVAAAHGRRSWTPTRWRCWPTSPRTTARTATSRGSAMQLLLDARTEKDEQAWWTRRGDRRLRHGRERRRGDHRPGRAGAAQVGRGVGDGGEGAELHRVEEGRVAAPGAPRRPPSWRCARCCCPRRRARPTCAARWRSR